MTHFKFNIFGSKKIINNNIISNYRLIKFKYKKSWSSMEKKIMQKWLLILWRSNFRISKNIIWFIPFWNASILFAEINFSDEKG